MTLSLSLRIHTAHSVNEHFSLDGRKMHVEAYPDGGKVSLRKHLLWLLAPFVWFHKRQLTYQESGET